MEQGNITVLNENSWGIRLVKTDLKKRSRVDVVNKYGEKLATYRFNNIPLYENQYMSWQNLDCCDGWINKKYPICPDLSITGCSACLYL